MEFANTTEQVATSTNLPLRQIQDDFLRLQAISAQQQIDPTVAAVFETSKTDGTVSFLMVLFLLLLRCVPHLYLKLSVGNLDSLAAQAAQSSPSQLDFNVARDQLLELMRRAEVAAQEEAEAAALNIADAARLSPRSERLDKMRQGDFYCVYFFFHSVSLQVNFCLSIRCHDAQTCSQQQSHGSLHSLDRPRR